MLRWFYVAMHLLMEASAARRDARIRFLKTEVDILRRKLGGNLVIKGAPRGLHPRGAPLRPKKRKRQR